MSKKQDAGPSNNTPTNYALLAPYILPYIAYVVIANLLSGLKPEINYSIRIITVSALLFWGWRSYVPFKGPENYGVSIVWGAVFGIIGAVLWIACLFPFVKPANTPWSNTAATMRLLSATVLVPVFEELIMRVYVFRVAYQWGGERNKKTAGAFENALHEKSLNDVKPGEWSIYAVVCSTVIFAMGHQAIEWPAAVTYGLLMAFLLITRKDILSCIIAHATTNLTLGLYVYMTGKWQYW